VNPLNLNRRLDVGLLIVEDDPVAAKNIQRYFNPFFKTVWSCDTPLSAMEAYETYRPGVIISDIELPHGSGIDLIRNIRKKDKKVLVFIVSAFPKEEYLLSALDLKLDGFLIKPLISPKLESIVRKCYEVLFKNEVCIDEQKGVYYSFEKKIIASPEGISTLTHLEITIFEKLLSMKNTILTYGELENALALENSFSRNSLRVLIARLRKKHPCIRIDNCSEEGYVLRC
jgi:two-component system, OmpR family, response regulator VanR